MEPPSSAAELAQARYERALLAEITKLQGALAEERSIVHAQKEQAAAEAAEVSEKKASESEKASRLQAMEKAIESAQKEEQRQFLKKRAAAERRMREREALAAKERSIEAKRKEQHRKTAQKLHEETLARAAEERVQAEESKRAADEAKEQKLRDRLAAEREALLERNLKKAEESAEKVQRAAELRVAQTEQQRQQHEIRTAAQQERMRLQKLQQDRRLAEIRAAAELKAQVIERAQVEQQAIEERKKQRILAHEADKQQRLSVKAAREAEARTLLQHEKVLQEAAARARVERTMGDLQAQLAALEGQLGARQDKLSGFIADREAFKSEGQAQGVKSSLERADLSNTMSKMRENLQGDASMYIEVPGDYRAGVQTRELKAILDRVDPSGEGHVSLASMRKELLKTLPPLEASSHARAKRLTSSSLPSLLTLEQKKMSQYDQYVAAFKAVDADGSGTISKRELYSVLQKAGLANGKQALEIFEGFDEDSDGSLDFEEFCKIAKILC